MANITMCMFNMPHCRLKEVYPVQVICAAPAEVCINILTVSFHGLYGPSMGTYGHTWAHQSPRKNSMDGHVINFVNSQTGVCINCFAWVSKLFDLFMFVLVMFGFRLNICCLCDLQVLDITGWFKLLQFILKLLLSKNRSLKFLEQVSTFRHSSPPKGIIHKLFEQIRKFA